MAFEVERMIVGPVGTNCYFINNTETGEVLLIDPGAEAERIIAHIEDNKEAKVLAILLTHGHFDHGEGAREVADHFGCEIFAPEEEKELFDDPQKNGSWLLPGTAFTLKVDRWFSAGDILTFGENKNFRVKVLPTPGHTPGGVSFLMEEEQLLFCGDTLFFGSVGRTDMFGGSQDALLDSIAREYLPLPDDTRVLPGHGRATTIAIEKKRNPYLRLAAERK